MGVEREYSCHYIVKDAYNKLDSKDHRVGGEAFHKLWKIKSTPTFVWCWWRVLNDRLWTRNRLARFDMSIENLCYVLCNKSAQSVCHLFFTYKGMVIAFLFLCVFISPCTGNIYKYMETFSPNYKLIMWWSTNHGILSLCTIMMGFYHYLQLW